MLIATAGHVDHGKTSLLQALTGINADRLPEEQRRGMTIDLGYAYWPQPDGRVIGFIDVPGHEKFLANMLAGIGGIDHALLLIACDDGVMPQTREHLHLLQLSGVPTLSVVLTKADRVSAERIERVSHDVQQCLVEHGLKAAGIFTTASTTGHGIAALQDHLRTLSPAARALDRPFRLAIDRVFTVKGAGTVVTGTALAGQVQLGDSLQLCSTRQQVTVQSVTVRSLHAQNRPTERASAGERIALNLRGADPASIQRGDWLLASAATTNPHHTDAPPYCDRLIVSLTPATAFSHWQPLHIYHAASHVTGRLALLSEPASTNADSTTQPTLAELRLDTPLLLTEQDCLLLRDISARQTLGAALVVDLFPPLRGKRRPERLTFWQHYHSILSDDAKALALRLTQGALDPVQFMWSRQLPSQTLRQLCQQAQVIHAGDHLLSTAHAAELHQRLLTALSTFHQQYPDQAGVSLSRLLRIALPAEPVRCAEALLRQLLQNGLILHRQGWLHLPTHSVSFNTQQQQQWAIILPHLLADTACWVRDLAHACELEESAVRSLLKSAAAQGKVTAIVPDRYCLQSCLLHCAELIRTQQATQGSTSAADFRDQLGIGRKLAIQILEYFDRSGFTRRRGNAHLLRDPLMFTLAEEMSFTQQPTNEVNLGNGSGKVHQEPHHEADMVNTTIDTLTAAARPA